MIDLAIMVIMGLLVAVVAFAGFLRRTLGARLRCKGMQATPNITQAEIADWVKTADQATGKRVHSDCFDAWADGHPVSDDCAAMLGGPR